MLVVCIPQHNNIPCQNKQPLWSSHLVMSLRSLHISGSDPPQAQQAKIYANMIQYTNGKSTHLIQYTKWSYKSTHLTQYTKWSYKSTHLIQYTKWSYKSTHLTQYTKWSYKSTHLIQYTKWSYKSTHLIQYTTNQPTWSGYHPHKFLQLEQSFHNVQSFTQRNGIRHEVRGKDGCLLLGTGFC